LDKVVYSAYPRKRAQACRRPEGITGSDGSL